MKIYAAFLLLSIVCLPLMSQKTTVTGVVSNEKEGLPYASVLIRELNRGTTTDSLGRFKITGLAPGSWTFSFSYLGHEGLEAVYTLEKGKEVSINIALRSLTHSLGEVVVSGTMKEVRRMESPVPVEVYRPNFFKKNPTPNIYEALQNVNGIRPQLNCNVCNTGDIHINGLEGPYTMVLIDGMPIVSSLATVYGLSGIPHSLVERMEIVKGPASSLYGSEAIGGLINIITKSPNKAPLITADLMATSWQEYNADLGLKIKLGNKATALTGINYFNYQQPFDKNDDQFTDVTLQERISVFQKLSFQRKDQKLFTLAGRYYWEERWGGEMGWNQSDRGGREVYGEAITTNRWELLGQYQLPTKENLLLSFSFNSHKQNSVYGDIPYIADQKIGFTQLVWDKRIQSHDLLAGTAIRYTYYDDNTTATEAEGQNEADEIWIPGIFVQDEISLNSNHKLLLGLRYDYNNAHGNIFTPRMAYKWSITPKDIFRLNFGTGFRVVNLFTEDHAALTGARDVIIDEELLPERSYNINANYIKKWYLENGGTANVELSAFYTYFTNIILPDYDTNPNQIIYDNLDGSAETKGLSMNMDISLPNGMSFLLGATLMDVSTIENEIRSRQILTERFTGTWAMSYPFFKNFSLDYTGNVYGPMLLPLLGDLDPRPSASPWWSIQNLQLTYKGLNKFELYGGVKNLLNWTPWKNQKEPIIARSFDPFDRGVLFDESGMPLATVDNPYALTFDPSYVYAPNQGIRAFLGLRYTLRE